MTEPDVRLELTSAEYRPGDEVAGAFVLAGGPPADCAAVELSVLWHTSGKGTEDLGVIFYRSWSAADGSLAALPTPGTFAVPLPPTPRSYDGVLVKVRWVARLRVRYGETGEVVREVPFFLGSL